MSIISDEKLKELKILAKTDEKQFVKKFCNSLFCESIDGYLVERKGEDKELTGSHIKLLREIANENVVLAIQSADYVFRTGTKHKKSISDGFAELLYDLSKSQSNLDKETLKNWSPHSSFNSPVELITDVALTIAKFGHDDYLKGSLFEVLSKIATEKVGIDDDFSLTLADQIIRYSHSLNLPAKTRMQDLSENIKNRTRITLSGIVASLAKGKTSEI